MSNLSEYEKKRIANIKENEEILKKLNLPSLGTKRKKSATKPTNTKQKVHTASKKIREGPTRLSARLRGKEPDMTITEDPDSVQTVQTFDSLDQHDHKKLLKIMEKTLVPNIEPVVEINGIIDDKNLTDQFKSLKIHHEWTTVKVTPQRINGCVFHPSTTKLLGCAVDTDGYLGFWDINGKEENGEAIVYQYKPHSRTITDVKFDPFDNAKLMTSSYDGQIKIFDMNKAEFESLSLRQRHFPITSFDIQQGGNMIWFSTSDGEIGRLDKRSKDAPDIYSAREKKIGCIHLNPVHQDLLAAGSNDRTTTVWDIRNMEKEESLHSFDHGFAVTSCYWSPKGDMLATTCYDDYVRLFQLNEEKDMQLKSAISHNNHTGRWVTNFRARWNTNKYHGLEHQHFIIGNMNQTVDIFSGESGNEMAQLYDDEHITAIPSVAQSHPSTFNPAILTGNGSGRMVCWTVQ